MKQWERQADALRNLERGISGHWPLPAMLRKIFQYSVDGEYDRGMIAAVRRATAAIANTIRSALEPIQRVSG